MTKKHFIAIAEILAHHSLPQSVVSSFADYFETLNPSFDRDRFFAYYREILAEMNGNI